MSEKTLVVWNPRSGSAESYAHVKSELLDRPACELVEVHERNQIVKAVRRAISQGAARIYAAGGDGTVNAAVSGVMQADRSVPLGVLPLGTGNDFCRTLGIPLDPVAALNCVDHGPCRSIDVVEIKGEDEKQFFVNMATAGNSDRVVEEITVEQKKLWGPFSYLFAAIGVARDLTTYKITIQVDNGPAEEFEVWNIVLANGRTSGGGLPVMPRADPIDGIIDLMIVRNGTLPDLLAMGIRLWLATLLESELVEYRQGEQIRITSEPRLRFTADGDLVEWVPLQFAIRPAAVVMFVGPEFQTLAAAVKE